MLPWPALTSYVPDLDDLPDILTTHDLQFAGRPTRTESEPTYPGHSVRNP
jgi:hypothetical protein